MDKENPQEFIERESPPTAEPVKQTSPVNTPESIDDLGAPPATESFLERKATQEIEDEQRIKEVRQSLSLAQNPGTQEKTAKLEISPAIHRYFTNMGPEKAVRLLSLFDKDGIEFLKDYILKGNLGYVIHLMQTAEMSANGYSFEQMAYDQTGNDPRAKEKGDKAFTQFIGKGLSTAAQYEKFDPSLPQGAQDILDELFRKE